MEQTLRPARPVSPGRILRQELDARGWTQRDLAAILGRPEQMVSEIINGTKRITPETSLELAQAFGVSPEFWYNLETNYRLERAKCQDLDDTISRRSRLYDAFPLQEMDRRGWLKLRESADALEAEVSRFFGFGMPALPEAVTMAARFRCSTARGPVAYAQLAWLCRAEQIARQQTVAIWKPEHVQSLLADLATLTARAEDVARVPQTLGNWGVRCVFLRYLSKTYLDGAAFYMDGEPCVALTLRYDRIDSFWFTLLHEIAHLAEGERGTRLDTLENSHADSDETRLAIAAADPQEARANEMASQCLLAPNAYQNFVVSQQSRFSKASIESFAASQHRHPGIVLGRLQRDGLVPYKNLRALLVKVSPYLVEHLRD